MSTLEERYPRKGPKHSELRVTEEEKQHINRVVMTFMHAEEHVRDAVLGMLKLLPFIDPEQRVDHIQKAFDIMSGFGLHHPPDVLDDSFCAAVRMTADYLNLDPDHFEALARRGHLAILN